MTDKPKNDGMDVVIGKPPVWEEANKLFKLEELKLDTVFTYGNTLYNPSGHSIPMDLYAHEQTHAHQHNHDDTVAKLWWKRYLEDPDFRVEQEAEAYGAQYAFLCKREKDRNKRAQMLWTLAQALSGPMYGGVITHSLAMRKIRDYAKM